MENKGYNENKRRGRITFPVQLYCVDRNHAQYVMPLHWHNEWELIRVVSGRLMLYVNNVPYPLSAGEIAVVNCKRLHRAEPKASYYECIVLDAESVAGKNNEVYADYIHPLVTGERFVDCLCLKEGSALYGALDRAFDILKKEEAHYQLDFLGALFTALKELYGKEDAFADQLSRKASKQTAYISEILNWIDRNHAEQITLQLLAERVGITPNYLCRIFKAYTGKTLVEYLNFVRMQRVCHEIRCSEKSITRIATDNGYNDISYFCKVFKKTVGVSAKRYKEKL